MNFGILFNLKGIRSGYLALAVALNVAWSIAMVYGANAVLQTVETNEVLLVVIGLLFGAFIVPFLIAWVIGRLAQDRRGVQYGFFGGLGGSVVLIPLTMTASLLGLMIIVAILSGGLNGGRISASKQPSKRG